MDLVFGTHTRPNRWKGFVLGVAGALVGLILMRFYWQQVAPVLAGPPQQEQQQNEQDKGDGGKASSGQGKGDGQGQQQPDQGGGGGARQGGDGRAGPLDSISVIGKNYRKGESSTAALGRIFYHVFTGQDPSSETKTALSYLVHWCYGMLMGGLYGAIRAGVRSPDLIGGLIWASGLWLFGDELVVPLLGLQGGPTSASFVQHVNRLGAHLFYGVGLALAAQSLYYAHDRLVRARTSG